MTPEEIKKEAALKIARARALQEIIEAIRTANGELDEAQQNFSQKQAAFAEIIKKAQDNGATMKNSGDAQIIVDQVLGKK